MKIEFLILLPFDEYFCASKKSFIDFLKIDDLLSVNNTHKISYRKSARSKDLISASISVETSKVKLKQERYFLVTLECAEEGSIDDFNDLAERVRSICERISPGKMTINTLWDDVGRIYAEKSYPLINEVENLLRQLIAKFMLINVGVTWSKDAIHPDLFKKIENFDDIEPYVNDLYKLDFIHLKSVLFDKKRDLSLDELDKILLKKQFSDEDKEKILKYTPRSNWEKYFSDLIDDKESSFERKWEILYKLRNKVAHNRHVKKTEFEKIKGLANQIKETITKAESKLNEIDVNEQDRQNIILSFTRNSQNEPLTNVEQSILEHYCNLGYDISNPDPEMNGVIDFIVKLGDNFSAITIKITTALRARLMLAVFLRSNGKYFRPPENISMPLQLVIVIKDDDLTPNVVGELLEYSTEILQEFSSSISVVFGKINSNGTFVTLGNSNSYN